jgi:prephenate dehydrogenase
MQTVAIVGVGLIGGSFGLALRKYGFTGDIIGVSSPAAIEAGLNVGAITRSASLEEAARAADLIYLAQPVDRILTTLENLQPLVKPGALVTDVGSTKQAIVAKAQASLPSAFLGGHPLAGKEQRGVRAAQADLFLNRPYILTRSLSSPNLPSHDFEAWLPRIGAVVLEMSPREHDSTVAFTSHLPQLVSTALAISLSRQKNSRLTEVFGPGLLDMTRLALSSPELWLSILRTNKAAVLAALSAYSAALADLQESLQDDSLVELFELGSAWAKELRTPRTDG